MRFMSRWPVLLLLLSNSISGSGAGRDSIPGNHPYSAKKENVFRETINLPDVLELVLARNPDLAVSAEEVRIYSSKVVQAGLRPNPEISGQVENIAGTGEMGWVHSAETTVQITLPLESASKRRFRQQKALREKEVAEGEGDARRSAVMTEAAGAFAEILACRERLNNRKELGLFAEKMDQAVRDRVAAGKVSPIEAYRSLVALRSAWLEKEKAEKEWEAAKISLSSLWNGTEQDFHGVQGSFRLPPRSLLMEVPEAGVSENPQIKLADRRQQVEKSSLSWEIAEKRPDFSLSIGYRHLNPLGDSAVVAGLSIPLPLFDQNQGNIEAARRRIEKAGLERAALANRLQSRIARQRQWGESAFLEANTLTEIILPAARNALDLLEEGYRQGKFDFLAVLDAQRTYTELQGKHIEAVAASLHAVIEIQSLTGEILQPSALQYLIVAKETEHETDP